MPGRNCEVFNAWNRKELRSRKKQRICQVWSRRNEHCGDPQFSPVANSLSANQGSVLSELAEHPPGTYADR
jgi:hypothetical protein